MLILTRKLGEGITIDEKIRVVVLEIKGNQIRLGIEAPRETRVYRDEVYKRILQENVQASQESSDQVRKVAKDWKTKGKDEKAPD
jgi:carbon storage regulator